MFNFNLLRFLIAIGILLQLTYFIKAESEQMCASQETQHAEKCKGLYKTPLNKADFKPYCCNLFAIERCILKNVPAECEPILRERYQNDQLKKGKCKPYFEKCDEHIISNIGTTLQPSTIQFNAKHETLKQSISHIPQTQTTRNSDSENSNLIAEGQRDSGYSVSKSILLLATCTSIVMVKHLSRWF